MICHFFSHSIEGGMPNLLCFSLFTVFSYKKLVERMGGWRGGYIICNPKSCKESSGYLSPEKLEPNRTSHIIIRAKHPKRK